MVAITQERKKRRAEDNSAAVVGGQVGRERGGVGEVGRGQVGERGGCVEKEGRCSRGGGGIPAAAAMDMRFSSQASA